MRKTNCWPLMTTKVRLCFTLCRLLTYVLRNSVSMQLFLSLFHAAAVIEQCTELLAVLLTVLWCLWDIVSVGVSCV